MFVRIMIILFFLILISQLIVANFDHRSSENLWKDIPQLIQKQRQLVKDFRKEPIVDLACFRQELSRVREQQKSSDVRNQPDIIQMSDGSIYVPMDMDFQFCQEMPLANKGHFDFMDRG